MMRLGLRIAIATITLLVCAARAQDGGLDYSLVDRATVRVFAVHGVETARVGSDSGVDRLIAVPEASHGSGVAIENGLVVTARHVIEGAEIVAVWVPGRERAYQASVVHEDEQLDFAVLVVDEEIEAHLPLRVPARQLHVREQVNAIGYPLDPRRSDPQSSQGIIGGQRPDGSLQLDIALNPGNSGGPLIDASENVVGIVVARGDPEQGVQGVGIAVPIAPIVRAVDALRANGDTLDRARQALRDRARGNEVAELVAVLVQVSGLDLIRDVIAVIERRQHSELLDRLRSLGDQSHDPTVLALTAAFFWDAAAVILERSGGRMRASQMPAGADRDLARDLLERAVSLCHRAVAASPSARSRSPFVAHVVYYFPTGGAAPAAVATRPAERGPAPMARTTSGRQARDDEPAPAPVAPHRPVPPYVDHRLWVDGAVSTFGGLNNNLTMEGVGVRHGLLASPYTVRAGIFALDPLLGGSVTIGMWNNNFYYDVNVELGAMMRLGTRYAAVLGGMWSPGFGGVKDRAFGGVLGGWRVFVGGQIDEWLIGLEWRGVQIDGYYPQHHFGVWLTGGLF